MCKTGLNTVCSKQVCTKATGQCVAQAVAAGAVCDADGSSCTPIDSCKVGVCVADTNICQCQQDSECAKLEDGDLCNGTLYCDKAANKCVVNPKTIVVCPSAGDSVCFKNSCAPLTGGCVLGAVATATACDDGEPCTAGDSCAAGKCVAGLVVCGCKADGDCPSEGNACTIEKCTSYKCGAVPAAGGAACDDGDACTASDACANGKCVGLPSCCTVAADCDDKNSCTADACLGGSTCGHSNKPDGAVCDDAQVCTNGTKCAAGSCAGGVGLNCDDGNACTQDSCQPGIGCNSVANTASCDDGNPCTLPDACSASACAGTPIKEGTPCDDANKCTIFDGCKAGVCGGAAVDAKVDCDDGVLCTLDSCDKVSGCNNGANCDDGYPCTLDSCDAKGCVNSAKAPDGAQCGQSVCTDGGCFLCEEQYVGIWVDDAGVKKVVCAPDYPVWGIRPESPVGAWLKDNGDGTITDSHSKLMWQKVTEANGMNWLAAKTTCDKLILAGKTDWRLPTLAELATLVDYMTSNPAVAGVFESLTTTTFYWSAVVPMGSPLSGVWSVGFNIGDVGAMGPNNQHRARCVR